MFMYMLVIKIKTAYKYALFIFLVGFIAQKQSFNLSSSPSASTSLASSGTRSTRTRFLTGNIFT